MTYQRNETPEPLASNEKLKDEEIVRAAILAGTDTAFERDVTRERVQSLLDLIVSLRQELYDLESILEDERWNYDGPGD